MLVVSAGDSLELCLSHRESFAYKTIHKAEDIYLFIYTPKLPGPAGVIKERPQIKPVVIWTVVFSMVGRSEGGHFMSVHRVHPEEMLNL